jgi:hypothetical protein
VFVADALREIGADATGRLAAEVAAIESWERLILWETPVGRHNLVEYIDAGETEAAYIAMQPEEVAARRPLPGPFTRGEGHSWVSYIPELLGKGDETLVPRGSTLMLYDGDRPFGLPHFMHAHIARYGAGRFAHWRDHVLFSTPDGSDPNADPSRFTFVADY